MARATARRSSRSRSVRRSAAKSATTSSVLAWIDDPLAGVDPIQVPAPDPASPSLRVKINGTKPAPAIYTVGSKNFRYWNAASALTRGAAFWSGLLPGRKWHTGASLPVTLDAGVDLNAYYDRAGLSFFHDTIAGRKVYSGASPDVVLHEMGHAVLDIIRPQLWNAVSVEAAAFHESFGDMAALLVGLQSPELRNRVLQQIGSRLYRSSDLSRMAEELGWAIHQIDPSGSPSNCLRNAVNSFVYRPPESLPQSGPDSTLSSEPHAFSRVFTAGAFEAMSNMVAVLGGVNDANLVRASRDFAKLLVTGIPAAPITPDYYAQVAVHLLNADQSVFQGRYQQALHGAFLRRGILPLSGIAPIYDQPRARGRARGIAGPRAATVAHETLPVLALPGESFGLGSVQLHVHIAGQAPRMTRSMTAGASTVSVAPTGEVAARWFVERLFTRGRVDTSKVAHGSAVAHPHHPHKTHVLAKIRGAVEVRRRAFDCGFD